MNDPIDPSPTPEDFSTWGFYCDSCKVFFDIQIDGAVHSSADGVSYSHKCGSGARYIGYDRRAMSETNFPIDKTDEWESRQDTQGDPTHYRYGDDNEILAVTPSYVEEMRQLKADLAASEARERELRERAEKAEAQLAEMQRPVSDELVWMFIRRAASIHDGSPHNKWVRGLGIEARRLMVARAAKATKQENPDGERVDQHEG